MSTFIMNSSNLDYFVFSSFLHIYIYIYIYIRYIFYGRKLYFIFSLEKCGLNPMIPATNANVLEVFLSVIEYAKFLPAVL